MQLMVKKDERKTNVEIIKETILKQIDDLKKKIITLIFIGNKNL